MQFCKCCNNNYNYNNLKNDLLVHVGVASVNKKKQIEV